MEVVEKFKAERIAKLEKLDLGGLVEIAKAVADKGENILLIDESEWTALVTKAAQRLYPEIKRPDAAFAKL